MDSKYITSSSAGGRGRSLVLSLSLGSWIRDTGDCPISGKNDACYLVICRWSWAFDGRAVFRTGMGMEMDGVLQSGVDVSPPDIVQGPLLRGYKFG
uniref:HDC17813 n=1 Tax=Drosophila melanogaster TaxID=7227 RepID=Q6IIK3_DROME|nr:TPA_inf: HDC17813 [Drosophila melanogaster]